MHIKSSENELTIKDLLITNGLNRNQIEERLKLIEKGTRYQFTF